MSRFSKPLIALALAIIPFFLFFGTTDMVRVNGEVVSDNRFNLGGLVMAIVGLVIVWGVLKPSAPKDAARKSVAVIAGLLCCVQIANSIDVIRIDPLDWIMPDRNLPALQYSALADNDYIFLTVKTQDAYRRTLTREKGEMVGEARTHQAYADLCHGGRYRVDLARAEQMPEYFDEGERAAVEDRGAALAASATMECSITRSNRLMGEDVDKLNRAMDLFDRLEAEYLAVI
nr:hypothetical protein [uncultured Devosia sp.]